MGTEEKNGNIQKINYQKEMEKILERELKNGEEEGRDTKPPTLLLHSCCGPCSSYVLEYMSRYFEIFLYYYNPNIDPPEEFYMRSREQNKVTQQINGKFSIHFIEGEYDKEMFLDIVRGLEEEPEGGARCMKCYRLRLEEAARKADEIGCDYFTTTLTISPMKDSQKLNAIGLAVAEKYKAKYLVSDFKKKNGYKRSVELSGELGLYRQDYCGCRFSMRNNAEKESLNNAEK